MTGAPVQTHRIGSCSYPFEVRYFTYALQIALTAPNDRVSSTLVRFSSAMLCSCAELLRALIDPGIYAPDTCQQRLTAEHLYRLLISTRFKYPT